MAHYRIAHAKNETISIERRKMVRRRNPGEVVRGPAMSKLQLSKTIFSDMIKKGRLPHAPRTSSWANKQAMRCEAVAAQPAALPPKF